ncbi:hypothetical protein [Actinomadura viridis]|uniref:hypothetical protein n=1 Tax=Actinomadura viridis TaxID=58110 RepID=UPI003CD0A4CE
MTGPSQATRASDRVPARSGSPAAAQGSSSVPPASREIATAAAMLRPGGTGGTGGLPAAPACGSAPEPVATSRLAATV